MRFIVHYIYLHLWVFIPSFFFFLFLTMRIPQFLNNPAKFHHIYRSPGNLCRYHVFFISLLDKILLNNTQKLTHVRISSHHLLKTLHLIHFEQFLFQNLKLVKLSIWYKHFLFGIIQIDGSLAWLRIGSSICLLGTAVSFNLLHFLLCLFFLLFLKLFIFF